MTFFILRMVLTLFLVKMVLVESGPWTALFAVVIFGYIELYILSLNEIIRKVWK